MHHPAPDSAVRGLLPPHECMQQPVACNTYLSHGLVWGFGFVQDGLSQLGIWQPSPIQANALPMALAGGNCAIQSYTGSGKVSQSRNPSSRMVSCLSQYPQRNKCQEPPCSRCERVWCRHAPVNGHMQAAPCGHANAPVTYTYLHARPEMTAVPPPTHTHTAHTQYTHCSCAARAGRAPAAPARPRRRCPTCCRC
jgi:hypothetical protein